MKALWTAQPNFRRAIILSLCCHALFLLWFIGGYAGRFSWQHARNPAASLTAGTGSLKAILQPPSFSASAHEASDKLASLQANAATAAVQKSQNQESSVQHVEHDGQSSNLSTQEQGSSSASGGAVLASGVSLSNTPQLLSDVTSEVYDATASGSLVFSLDVDAQGKPSNLKLLSSNLAPEVAQLIEWRMLFASFKPAEENGVAVAASMEIQITVDATHANRRLDAS